MIATARGKDKLDVCRRLGGAEFAVDYSQEGWQKEVMNITGGKGVDVVFDPVVSPFTTTSTMNHAVDSLG